MTNFKKLTKLYALRLRSHDTGMAYDVCISIFDVFERCYLRDVRLRAGWTPDV